MLSFGKIYKKTPQALSLKHEMLSHVNLVEIIAI